MLRNPRTEGLAKKRPVTKARTEVVLKVSCMQAGHQSMNIKDMVGKPYMNTDRIVWLIGVALAVAVSPPFCYFWC